MSGRGWKQVLDFFFELGQLKRTARSGWWYVGIKHPESVAEHSCRATFIAFVLAKLEGADPHKSALIAAFHDMPETRIDDLHKIAQHYFPGKREVERRVVADQLAGLPKDVADEFRSILDDYESDNSLEQVVAKDADYLECAIQAKEYLELGHKSAQQWIDNTRGCLRTKSAKKFLELLEKSTSTGWYPSLKNLKR